MYINTKLLSVQFLYAQYSTISEAYNYSLSYLKLLGVFLTCLRTKEKSSCEYIVDQTGSAIEVIYRSGYLVYIHTILLSVQILYGPYSTISEANRYSLSFLKLWVFLHV